MSEQNPVPPSNAVPSNQWAIAEPALSPTWPDLVVAVAETRRAIERVRKEVHKAIVGQDDVVEQAMLAILCGGHAVVEGVPGLAKTLLVSSLARTLSLQFSRVQFTPDLMPSDMTGTEVIQEDRSTGSRSLRFVKGPIFANIVLADEINRTPPKTQSALLEAMQERQVTVNGVQYRLPNPFFVLATQNPIEQEGTYPLPEAQLDRFMLNIRVNYPTEAEELEIVSRTTSTGLAEPTAVLSAEDIVRMQALVRQVPVSEDVLRHAIHRARHARPRGGRGDQGVPRLSRMGRRPARKPVPRACREGPRASRGRREADHRASRVDRAARHASPHRDELQRRGRRRQGRRRRAAHPRFRSSGQWFARA